MKSLKKEEKTAKKNGQDSKVKVIKQDIKQVNKD